MYRKKDHAERMAQVGAERLAAIKADPRTGYATGLTIGRKTGKFEIRMSKSETKPEEMNMSVIALKWFGGFWSSDFEFRI